MCRRNYAFLYYKEMINTMFYKFRNIGLVNLLYEIQVICVIPELVQKFFVYLRVNFWDFLW